MIKTYQELSTQAYGRAAHAYPNSEFQKVAMNSFIDGYMAAVRDLASDENNDTVKWLSDSYDDIKEKNMELKRKYNYLVQRYDELRCAAGNQKEVVV